jgi:hypothetical protein
MVSRTTCLPSRLLNNKHSLSVDLALRWGTIAKGRLGERTVRPGLAAHFLRFGQKQELPKLGIFGFSCFVDRSGEVSIFPEVEKLLVLSQTAHTSNSLRPRWPARRERVNWWRHDCRVTDHVVSEVRVDMVLEIPILLDLALPRKGSCDNP